MITNPATLAAANTFAAARNAAGIRTSVFQTGSGPGQVGTTPAEIQTLHPRPGSQPPLHPPELRDDHGRRRPRADVPRHQRHPVGPPVLDEERRRRAAGPRGRAASSATTRRRSAPRSTRSSATRTRRRPARGCSHATIAAQFQDDDNDGQENRTFITFAETRPQRAGERAASRSTASTSERPGNNPQKFNDGTDLPADAEEADVRVGRRPARDVTAAWNEGRFLVVHRDHGWSRRLGPPRATAPPTCRR